MRGSAYAVDQPGFLNGYLAAGISKTGKVGTYGGIQFPAVTAFMDGFYDGVQHYNQVKGAKSVEVLGWDPTTQTGLFAGNFDSTDDGRRLGEKPAGRGRRRDHARGWPGWPGHAGSAARSAAPVC